MSLEKWVEHGWLRREPTSPVKSKVFWELWNVVSPMQRSKPYRPIIDSSLHSTRRSASYDCAPRIRSSHRNPSGSPR
jgi:hypothetical protein